MGNKKDKKNKKGKKGKKREIHAVGRAPTYTKNLSSVEDFLDEHEMKSFEKYGCISFASPGETMREQFKVQISTEHGIDEEVVDKVVEAYIALEHPKRAVKYLGGRATPEECATRIQEVMDDENAFHIYTIENGKWVTFDPSPELIENENYREEQLNEIMREKKMAEKRTKQFFRSEMRKKVEKARLEGTEAGQQILLEEEEPFQAVQHRVKAADESIAEFEAKIAEMKRTKEIAERKVEKMIAEGKDKIDVAAETEMKLQQLASEKRAEEREISAAMARRSEIASQLKEMGDIESARVWPENLGQETAKAMQPEEERVAELEQKLAELEQIRAAAEERIAALQQAQAEGARKREPPAELTAPTGDAMFDGGHDGLLIPGLRRELEAPQARAEEAAAAQIAASNDNLVEEEDE